MTGLLGSIPACAGEPPRGGSSSRSFPVYPRVCGGTARDDGAIGRPMGLSPRVRGNRRPGPRSVPFRRSIPACAGEPAATVAIADLARVYPRVCGGTEQALNLPFAILGLSPRVRGNPPCLHSAIPGWRSIPACAGEPATVLEVALDLGVYPRVCGGTRSLPYAMDLRSGLSPRVRGNPRSGPQTIESTRSIPACAGEPFADGRRPGVHRVYPRVCGGTVGCHWSTSVAVGLSPRVRGNHATPIVELPGPRSIPACAGEPSGKLASTYWTAVYPRVCGGTRGTPPTSRQWWGLSPRVRGNRGQHHGGS